MPSLQGKLFSCFWEGVDLSVYLVWFWFGFFGKSELRILLPQCPEFSFGHTPEERVVGSALVRAAVGKLPQSRRHLVAPSGVLAL